MTKVRRILVALMICSVTFTVGGFFSADGSGTAAYGAKYAKTGSVEQTSETEPTATADEQNADTGGSDPMPSSPLEERTISAEVGSNTVEVTAPVTDDITVEATEIREKTKGYNNYVNQAAQTMNMNASEFTFARVLDITPIDLATGEEFQPDGNAKVSVKLADEKIGKNEEVAVLHFTDAAADAAKAGAASGTANATDPSATVTPEVVESEVNGRTVEFETDGFSVFVLVGYTVDFHWGEYTYNLAGGSEIFLSELLPILAENGTGAAAGETGENNSASQTEQLKKVAKDMSLVKSVTFSNPELVQVDEVEILDGKSELIEDENSEKLVEHTRKDWRLWSLQPFDTEEKLTITLTDGEKIEVLVTDEKVPGTAAGGSAALPRVTADGVTYVLHNTATPYADVYAISAGSTIHETIIYNGNEYPTMDIRQTEGDLTKKPTDMDVDLVIRTAENYSFDLPDIKTDISNEEKQELSDKGYTEGTGNNSSYKVWKKAEYNSATNSIDYTMKYFQAMKDDSKIDFIFIYDDSASMYSGTRTTQTGVKLREAQTTRVVILDAVNALLPHSGKSQKENYDIQVYLGGASTGHTTMAGPFNTYEDVATSLSTYRTGATKHDTGVANALAAAKASKKAGRQPVVVYLSDFHQPGSLTRNSSNLTALHNIALVYGLSTDYRYGVNRASTDIPTGASFMHKMDDIKGGVEELEKIILEAIGYYIKDKVTVTDNLSDALKGYAVSAGRADGGSAPAGTGKSVWSIGGSTTNSGGDTVYSDGAGKIYTENFSVKLDDSTIYAGAMPTNSSATVYIGGEKVNEIDPNENDLDHLHLMKDLQFTLGRLDEKGRPIADTNGVPSYPVKGIKFKLVKEGETNPVVTDDSDAQGVMTTGNDGIFSIPYKDKSGAVVFNAGDKYFLEELEDSVTGYNETHNTLSDPSLVHPDKKWIITVDSNYVITIKPENAANQTPECTVAKAVEGNPARFVLWNEIITPVRLIPVTVQKNWPEDAVHKDPVPFTIKGVSSDGKKYELPAYDGSDADTAGRVKYIEGDTNENTWSMTVYVPDKIEENGTTIKFYDSDIKREAQLNAARDYYVDGVKYETPAALIAAKGVDFDGSGTKVIEYNQSYRYAIEEGDLIYEDGWYSPTYTNNATATSNNTTQPGTDYKAKTKGVDAGSSWEDYTGETSTDMYASLDVYTFSYRGDGLSDFENFFENNYHISGITEYKNFFNKLEWLEYTIVDNATGSRYKLKSYVSGSYDMKDSLSHGVVLFRGIKVPKEWATDRVTYNFSSGKYQISGSGTKLTIEQITCGFDKNGQKYSFTLYGGGVTHEMPWGPNRAANHWNTALVPLSGADSHSYNNEHTFSTVVDSPAQEMKYWHVVSAEEPQDDPTNSFSTKSCALPITNAWNPNPLVPVTVKKNWVNKDGGAVPANIVEANSPIKFTLNGTTESGGTKPVKLYSSGSWDSETTGELTGETSDPEWEETFYVPTYDVLGTYDPDTHECEKYTYGDDSLTEDNTLTAKINGEDVGEWDEPTVEYESQGKPIYGNPDWIDLDPAPTGKVYYQFTFNTGTKMYYDLLYMEYKANNKRYRTYVELNDSFNPTANGKYYFEILTNFSKEDLSDVKVWRRQAGTSTITSFANDVIYKGEFVDSVSRGYSKFGPNVKSITPQVYDTQITGYEAPIFTITNKFTPNVPVNLSSTFKDSTEDKASTGLISSVVYTIKGKTKSGEDYSRVVKTSAEPTSGGDANTVISSLGRTVYVPKGNYTIEQTAYTLDGSTQYATKAYKTTYGSSETEGIKQTVTLDNTATTTNVSFDNVRKDLPIKVRTLFEPGLTDDEAAAMATRPMKDRQFTYKFIYTAGNGEEHELTDAAYLLDDSKFNDTAKNYVNEHTNAHIPSYSVRGILTECDISGSGIEDALPDYMTTVSSEEKEGKLIFTIAASIKRAQVIVQKSWDDDIAAEDRQGVTLKFSIRRSDNKNIYGTEKKDCNLTITTDEHGEATGKFSLCTDEEQTDIYLPTLRKDEVTAGVKYILTEVSASKDILAIPYYVNFADLTKNTANKFEQTNPTGKNIAVGSSPANEARFVLNTDGIIIDVNNANNPYICKIDDGQEHPFRTLNKAVKYARDYLQGKATIEMLVDYEIPQTDRVTLDQSNDNITITTAATSGGEYNFTPTFTMMQGRLNTDSGSTAILKRDWDDSSGESFLFKTTGSSNDVRLTTTNITFDGTQANIIKYSGRLMYINKGSLEIKGGTTVRNFKQKGDNSGAIYTNARPVTLTANAGETILFDNCVTGGEGGAIRPAGGSVTINNEGTVRFKDCSASTAGGAISTNSGSSSYSVSITNSGTLAFENCTCSSSQYGGGAIWTGAFTATNTGTIDFDTCTAPDGYAGAIAIGGLPTSTVTNAGLTITNNGTGSVTFTDCEAGSSKNGGGIYANGSVSITGTGSTSFTKCDAYRGGGIYQNRGTMTLTNVTFGTANTTDSGCTADLDGGCVFIEGGAATLTDCSFYYGKVGSSTSSASTHGGGVHYDGNDELKLLGCVFDNCINQTTSSTSSYGNGGAVYVIDSASKLTVDANGSRRTSFTDCSARRFGGAIHFEKNGGTVEINDADFTNCHTEYRGGGAVFSDSTTTSFSDCTFNGCYSESTDSTCGGGGAIYTNADNTSAPNAVTASDCVFNDCHVKKNGGAIQFNSSGTTATLTNVSINGHTTGNTNSLSSGTANAESGGAIYSKGNITIKTKDSTTTNDEGETTTIAGVCEIKNCSVSDPTGGAVNAASGKKISFEGNVVVYDNVSGGQQRNVVLQYQVSSDYSKTINTTVAGLGENAHIGVYVTGNNVAPYTTHGQYEQDFGSYPSGGSTAHFDAFTNDRNGLYGEISSNANRIRWQSYLCKLTDSDGKLLYTTTKITPVGGKTVTISGEETAIYPAVYNYLMTQSDTTKVGGFTAAQGTLYTSAGVAVANDAAVQVQMLKNYTQPNTDAVTNTAGRAVTLKTANTTATANDVFVYNPGNTTGWAENDERRTTATITRGSTGNSMFSSVGSLTTANIILDGGSENGYECYHSNNRNGGIINATAGTVTVNEGTTMRNSTADAGGGAIYTTADAVLTVNGGAFTNCQADDNNPNRPAGGGAIFANSDVIIGKADGSGTVTFTGCKATGTGYGRGGAICQDGSGTLTVYGGTTFADCKAAGKSPYYVGGGAIYTVVNTISVGGDSGKVTFTGCEATGKHGGSGGALMQIGIGSLTLKNVDFTDCVAYGGDSQQFGYGGAVYSRAANVTLGKQGGAGKVTFTNCKAVSKVASNGGGLCQTVSIDSTSSSLTVYAAEFSGCEVCGNNNSYGRGGGLYTTAKSVMLGETDVEGKVSFTRCKAPGKDNGTGGGLYQYASEDGTELRLYHVTFTNCEADGVHLSNTAQGGGGGLFAKAKTIVIQDSNFTNCNAGIYGGGLRLHQERSQSAADIKNTSVTGCIADNGGGLAITSSVRAEIVGDSKIENNTANAAGGGVFINSFSATQLTLKKDGDNNPSVSGNKAGSMGGGIYVKESSEIILQDNPSIKDNTITGNVADVKDNEGAITNPAEKGAGIYLSSASSTTAKLKLSGSPVFAGNMIIDSSFASGSDSEPPVATNGGEPMNANIRQDIYTAENKPDNPGSILVTGELTGDPGSIWVWAEKESHYKQLMPFARWSLASGVPLTEAQKTSTMAVFRNAQTDEATENGTDTYLFGTTGENTALIYWTGIEGYRKVILRKVNNSYTSLSGREFTIYKGTSATAYTPKGETASLSGLTSGSSGCFWVGDLPYGWYIVKETNPSRYFFIVVTASGTYGTLETDGGVDKDKVDGYGTLAAAQDAAKEKYEKLK